MIYVECDQGSDDWHRARAGCCTASMFAIAVSQIDGLDPRQQRYVDAILAGNTEAKAKEIAGYKSVPRSDTVARAIAGEVVGKPSEAALNYAFRLAIERISGEPLDEGFETWSMSRGRELEPEARRLHEIESGLLVQRVGFVKTDDGHFGASLDGVIGEDGASEYKCFVDPAKLRAIWIDNDIAEVAVQAQGQLWVTGRKWVDVCLYCPALKAAGKDLWSQRFFRDEEFISTLELDLVKFIRIVNDYEKVLRAPLASNDDAAAWPFPQQAA